MPPKAAPSKKEVKNKQKQVVEDKTFGLKNKNKSKVVQSYVSQVVANAKRAGISKDEAVRREQQNAERAAKKEENKKAQQEMAFLFAPAVSKKQKEADKKKKEEAEAAAKKAAAEGPEFMDSDQAYHEAKRAEDLARAEAVLGEQKDDDLFDQIERERAELKKKGGLTPVTYDSFVAWKARKAEEKQRAAAEEAKKALAAAKNLKGKSGRDLFNQLVATNADLFLDDDEADDDWMVRDDDDDDTPIYDVTVTGTTFSLRKVGEEGAAGGAPAASAGAKEAGAAGAKADGADALAAGVDAALFLDDDVDLPSDDDDDE